MGLHVTGVSFGRAGNLKGCQGYFRVLSWSTVCEAEVIEIALRPQAIKPQLCDASLGDNRK